MNTIQEKQYDDAPDTHYAPHVDPHNSTIHILSGSMDVRLEDGERFTYSVGDQIDIPIGMVHEAWVGAEGCGYTIIKT